MNIRVERLPFTGNENILTDYWLNHIPEWKMNADSILFFSNNASQHLWIYIAFKDNNYCGILVSEEADTSSLWLIHVIAPYRNKGIGGKLFDSALENAGNKWTAGLGSGYWWQGVPLGCGDLFLEKKGFEWSWTSIDMVMSLNEWAQPDHESDINIGKLMPNEASTLISLLEGEADLSGWVNYYKDLIEDDAFNQILVVRIEKKIVGCTIVLLEQDIRWRDMIGGKVGGVGCIGVQKAYRERGIGASLVHAVNGELKRQKFTHSYIGYTWLEKWYRKMGYEIFSSQRMGQLAYNIG